MILDEGADAQLADERLFSGVVGVPAFDARERSDELARILKPRLRFRRLSRFGLGHRDVGHVLLGARRYERDVAQPADGDLRIAEFLEPAGQSLQARMGSARALSDIRNVERA